VGLLHKPARQTFIETNCNWPSDDHGILYAHGIQATLPISKAAAGGQKGREWAAEHLLLGAIIGAYGNTFIELAAKYGAEVLRLECRAIAQVEILEGRPRFTNINLYPVISISANCLPEDAARLDHLTREQSAVGNALNANIYYHTSVITQDQQNDLKTASGITAAAPQNISH
jgi:hypothetical protein